MSNASKEMPVRQQRIMVFNQSDAILDLFHDILIEEGYTVSTHLSSTLHPPAVATERPDLLILEVPNTLRGEPDWQLLQQLTTYPGTQDISLIVCTTNLRGLDNHRTWLMAQGICALPKLFTVDALLAAVETQLAARGSTREEPLSGNS